MNWNIIVFFIISIILFLVTKYYFLKKKLALENIENFENESILTPSDKLLKYHGVEIKYLDIENAKKLIVKDGEYLQGMNQANLSSRGCSSIDELYSKYKTAFEEITNDEKEIVDSFLLKLLTDIKENSNNSNNGNNGNNAYYNYVVRWLKTISIAKAKPWLESGMPHTLDKTIIMDASWFKSPRKKTMIHEITHVHQRMYPTEFEDLYPLLGYYYNPVDIKGLENIYPLNRNNPDGMDKYWLWQNSKKSLTNYWWIGAIFKTAIPDNLTDVNLMALKLDKEIDSNSNGNSNSNNTIFYYLKQNPTPLKDLKEFNEFFGDNPNNYHPNEMTAKFAELFLIDNLQNNNISTVNNSNYEGYKIYKNYFEKLLNTYYK